VCRCHKGIKEFWLTRGSCKTKRNRAIPGPSAWRRGRNAPITSNLNNAIANTLGQTSANSNGVLSLSQGANGSYNQSQMQDVLNKLDELINAPRR